MTTPAPVAATAPPAHSTVMGEPSRALAAPRWVVARQTSRRSTRSGLLWGTIFGGYVALQMTGYVAAYKTLAERSRFAATFSSGGLTALTGPAREIGTVAGFTAWKCLGILTVVGAVWGLLTSTKLIRGEEDAGRWELLLSGQTTPRGACIQAMAGLLPGLFALFGMTAILTVAIGHGKRFGIAASAGLFFSLAVVASAAMFLAVGALASQLVATRRQAAAGTGAAFGACFGLRMVADSSHQLSWARGVSPLGWIEQLEPLTGSRAVFLLPIVGLSVASAAAAGFLAGRRDVGASVLPDRQGGRSRTRLLSGPVGLAVQLTRASTIGWLVGVAATSALIAAIAKKDVTALKAASSTHRVLVHLGGRGDLLKVYLAVSFLIIGLMIMLLAAEQVAAIRREESTGRVEHLLVRPVSRQRWLAERWLIATTVITLAGFVAGLSAWLGLAGQHTGVSLAGLLNAGIGAAVAAFVLLGIGVLVLGVAPRLATATGFCILAWSFLVELLAGVAGISHWILDTSLLHQTLAEPAHSPDLTTVASLVTLGAGAAVIGLLAFTRRDVAGE